MREGEVSPVEVLKAHLERVELLNPVLNAVVALAPDALEEARELERKIRAGVYVGILAGAPVTVKDTFETRGIRTTFGSKVFKHYVPEKDAPAVAQLKRAGALIFAKSNAAELALEYAAENPVYGRTNNPFDFARTPGGSSGGCAAAVSACMSAAGLGSDLAGSIRIPAHFCGVAGLRPTTGRVPAGGHLPPFEGRFSHGASAGPIARSVEDLSLVFKALTVSSASKEAEEEFVTLDEKAERLRGIRFCWYARLADASVNEETERAVEFAARALEDAGLSPTERRPPHVERATELWLALFSGATEDFLLETFTGREDEAGPAARFLLERAARRKKEWEKSYAASLENYSKTLTERDALRAELLEWMNDTPLLVAPVGAVEAFEHGAQKVSINENETASVFRAFGFAQAFNVFDLPSVAVRAGFTRGGLPVGVQVVARPGRESEALAAARIIEEASGGWRLSENLLKVELNPL